MLIISLRSSKRACCWSLDDIANKSILPRWFDFIRLRLNTLQLAAGMKGKANRAVAPLSEGGSGCGAIPL
jgi:hypothetical protein